MSKTKIEHTVSPNLLTLSLANLTIILNSFKLYNLPEISEEKPPGHQLYQTTIKGGKKTPTNIFT